MATKPRRSKGDGSWSFQIEKHRWRGAFTSPSGKRFWVVLAAPPDDVDGRKSEARFLKKVERVKKEMALLGRSASTGTVKEYIEGWLKQITNSIQPSTLVLYQTATRYLIEAAGAVKLVNLQANHIQDALDLAAKECSPSTRRTYLKIFRVALNAAVERDFIIKNVAKVKSLRPAKEHREELATFSELELAKLASVCHNFYNGASVDLNASLGLRAGEVLGLKWSDWDERRNTLSITRQLRRERRLNARPGEPKTEVILKELKTGNSRRVLGLSSDAVAALRKHRAVQREWRRAFGGEWKDTNLIFPDRDGGLWHESAYWRTWNDIVEAAGIPYRTFHTIRHTVATLLIEHGETVNNAAAFLGDSIQVFMNTYLHAIRKSVAEIPSVVESFRQQGVKELKAAGGAR